MSQRDDSWKRIKLRKLLRSFLITTASATAVTLPPLVVSIYFPVLALAFTLEPYPRDQIYIHLDAGAIIFDGFCANSILEFSTVSWGYFERTQAWGISETPGEWWHFLGFDSFLYCGEYRTVVPIWLLGFLFWIVLFVGLFFSRKEEEGRGSDRG